MRTIRRLFHESMGSTWLGTKLPTLYERLIILYGVQAGVADEANSMEQKLYGADSFKVKDIWLTDFPTFLYSCSRPEPLDLCRDTYASRKKTLVTILTQFVSQTKAT